MIEFYGGYQVYSESGVDLTLLRENLRRSLEERWENNRRALALAEGFEEAGRRRRGLPARPREGVSMFKPEAILQQLLDHGVEFVVIGGLAMTIHGSAYITRDLDLCYRRTADNIAALATALAPLHPYLRGAPPGLPFRFDAPTIQAGLNFTLTTDLGALDLLGELAGVGTAEEVLAHSEEQTIFGLKVRVLSLDALIASKKAAGRLKDQTHLLELEELKKLKETPPEA
ncbi:MAG: nucleotidyltransferase [Gemmataceae bacterium]|nr:nucleotidyltransferase [Gemmataceae bacterium]